MKIAYKIIEHLNESADNPSDLSKVNDDTTFDNYPKAGSSNAQKAIDWKEKHGDEVKGGTQVGWTRANQLANKEPISFDTVKRISAFNRHRKNSKVNPEFKDTPWRDNGVIAWAIWGGTEMVDWAMELVDRVEKAKKNESIKEEKLPALVKKSKESGISYTILKDVFDRGVGAYKTNPSSVRPNVTSKEQWAYARVNSFIDGGKTRTTADKDLWDKHKGSK